MTKVPTFATTGGYVKLYRSMLEWEWIGDPNVVTVFVQIMLRTNREAKRWQGVDIPAGSFLTSRDTLAASCGLSEKQVRRALDVLESGRTITRSRAGTGQLVTLVKWAEYQEQAVTQGRSRADERAEAGPKQGRNRAATEEVIRKREGEKLRMNERLAAFRERCLEIHRSRSILDKEQSKLFFEYWTEISPNGKKHRWEFQKTFDIALRMQNWKSRIKPLNSTPHGRQESSVERLARQIAAGELGDEAQAELSRAAGTAQNGGTEHTIDADFEVRD